MKKLYISCPAAGRTPENVKKSFDKMHRFAEIMFGQELEVVNKISAKEIQGFDDISDLKGVVDGLSKADYFIGTYCDHRIWKRCNVENSIATSYNIKRTLLHTGHNSAPIFPDIEDVVRTFYSVNGRDGMDEEYFEF